MRLTIVGSGTAAPEPERVGSGFFVEAGGQRLLVDCGPGVVHHMARFRLDWQAIDHVVLTHFHNDHIGDVPALLFALKWGVEERRTKPLRVWAPAGVRDRLHAMATAFGDHVADPGFPVEVEEVEPGDVELPGGLRLRVAATPHTDRSLAYRLEDGGGALGFTGDTGPSPELARFLAGVHVLVAECSLPDDQAIGTHLSPSSLAAMAATAAPARLVVTHVYPRLARQDVDRLLREAGWKGATLRAHDGLVLDIPPA